MITQTTTVLEPPSWQTLLKEAITVPSVLWQELNLDSALLPAALRAADDFQLRIPRGFVQRMRPGDPQDPLLLQVLPLGQELQRTEGYLLDPLQEKAFNPVPGLLHKYHGRVLLTLTGVCAVNCRYCFRRHFPYGENNPGRRGWEEALRYIAADSSIQEVILSGGDPLLVTDEYLAEFIEKLEGISHLNTLRFHTRLPIVLPERITAKLSHLLKSTRLKVVVVVHCNHAQEIDASVRESFDGLRAAACTLLNQSVLLKDVNNHPQTLANLSQALFSSGVLPYYLHVLDPVQGAQHFEVSDAEIRNIYTELQALLPGYLVPKLVQEKPGARGKQLYGMK